MTTSFLPSSTRRARARCLALLAALMVTLVGSAAWAMPAPMCNEDAQSIAAPFPTLPSHNGELRGGSPCESRERYELGRAPAPDREQPPPPQLIERAPPVRAWSLPRDRGRKLPPFEATPEPRRSGFELGIFRPPRVH